MTTHDHPSDEAKPLEGEFATETDLPEEAVRSLDTDRTEDKDADQPGEAPAPHSASFRDRFGLSTRAWRVIGVIGLVLSAVAATVMAILGNLVITPMWLGVPLDAVVAMILPILTPFNLIKAGINAVLTLIVYKSISNLITPKKKQVKGR